MIGDVGDYVKLVTIVKKKVCQTFPHRHISNRTHSQQFQKKLEVPPSEFIVGSNRKGEDDGADLDDDAVVCSCHVSSPSQSINDVIDVYSRVRQERGKRTYHEGSRNRV